MDINQLLEAYVKRHNEGVTGGNFTELMKLFAVNAELRFVGVEIAPCAGRDAVAAAFKAHPPSDALVLQSVMAGGNRASAIYGWAKTPAKKGGTLVMTEANGLIGKLTIAVAQTKA